MVAREELFCCFFPFHHPPPWGTCPPRLMSEGMSGERARWVSLRSSAVAGNATRTDARGINGTGLLKLYGVKLCSTFAVEDEHL